ncbi:cyclase family protein [Aquimarina sp. AD10]|uniref:cyclase family protein n=1 Tax=Aquimarina sp. AD10 TaxID=1714849 RepID=UPI000E5242DA|nr:cyclase family protein [Aquimarina sp. AD10]AXT61209.1 cyclase family protein [Aquimarina sp. AD10]RKN02174.1 cyclase family protein [Aquimarina sp. AD10]
MYNVVDLTVAYSNEINGFTIQPSKTIETDGWNASMLSFYSHCGTHMDAPIHFDVTNQTIDQISISNCIGKAWIIDVRKVSAKGLLYSDHIQQNIKERFIAGDSLIFWTNWSQHIHSPKYRDELPRISEELALWCLENKVKMIGVEPPSVADVNNIEEVTKIHQILLKGVIIIEGLTNIDKLKSDCVELIALPLKITGGDGAPARVIAIEKY